MRKTNEEDLITKMAVVQLQVEGLTKALDILTQEVKVLTAIANQGRGSIRMLFILGTLWTSIVALLGFIIGQGH